VALAALPPPAIVEPAPYEVSFGRVAGRLPSGARRIEVRADGRVLAVRRVRGRRFYLRVALPGREVTVRVTVFDARRRRASATVPHVLGLPRAARPRGVGSRNDPALAGRLRALARGFSGVAGIYVQDLGTGAGASWNARARLTAASTLKVAIAVEALRTLRGKPALGSSADRLLRAAIERSDNAAANALEVIIAGSTSAGSHRVNALMRSLGLRDSEMYGGYERSTSGRKPIPRRVESQPSLGRGKYTTAYDMARLLTLVHLAAEGKGLLAERYGAQFTPADARYLLSLLARANDRGKLDRFLPRSALVAHKAGWLSHVRHDTGLVYWPGGVFVAAVLTYGRIAGSDVLAGRVAQAALAAFSRGRRLQAASAENPIPSENGKAGTTGWKGPDVEGRAIEGYASEVSVLPGGTVRFHVSTSPPELYHIHVYRLGWYGGTGGREVACMPTACNHVSDGKSYPVPSPDPGTGRVVTGWPVTDELKIPEDWVSGYHVAVEARLAGEVDDRRPAATDLAEDLVAPDLAQDPCVRHGRQSWTIPRRSSFEAAA